MFYGDPTSDLVWVDVPKNMSSTMNNIVGINKWQRYTTFEQVPKNLHIFCIIQNPWRRFVKGMAENAWTVNERSFVTVCKTHFYQMSFMQRHTLPISAIYPDVMPYMNYVAMDHLDYTATNVLNDLFERHHSTARIASNLNKHVSPARKIKYQLEVEQWLLNSYKHRKQVDYFNQVDHNNWRSALKALDPKVESRTWLQRFLNRI
jgi:hypothetical protein